MSQIKAIIFDLGGVILNLDQALTSKAFKDLGADEAALAGHLPMFNDFETGKISAETFRASVHKLTGKEITYAAIDQAWNAMLLDLPAARFEMLRELKKKFRLYLLSNTNSIHIDCFNDYLQQAHCEVSWVSEFDKVYYSYEIGLRKPNADIYEYVLKDTGHAASECIFIDDTAANLVSPAALGIHTIHATAPLSDKMMREIYGIAKI